MTKGVSYFVSRDYNRNRYQNLSNEEIRRNTTSRPTITTGNRHPPLTVFHMILFGFFIGFLYLLVISFDRFNGKNISVFYFNTDKTLVRTSDKFLSFGLDTSLLRIMNKFPLADERFINLARHLKPAFVRIGGTSADCLFFNKTRTTSAQIINSFDGQDISNFTITNKDFESLYNFTVQTELRMLFDLNVLIRYPNGSWDDTNAKDIISFAKLSDMDLDWQLGNEPNSFHHNFNITITAEQLAKDYIQLRNILNQIGYKKSLLVGPEVNHIDLSNVGQTYAEIFLKNNNDSVNYVTWHQYYLNGRKAIPKDFLNPLTFDLLPMQIESISNAIKQSGTSVSMWLSETGSAFGGGAPGLSDKYIAGFLWLDKLGYSAKTGVNVVIRQSLFGNNYAMIGPDLLPNPDWWISVIYKQFVSDKVLEVTSFTSSRYIRIYAHCTPEISLINRVNAITIFGMNLNITPSKIMIQGIFHKLHKNAKIFVYNITSGIDGLTSRNITLNGEVLKLESNGKLPPFNPIILNPTQFITLSPFSMVFMVIHGIDAPACIS